MCGLSLGPQLSSRRSLCSLYSLRFNVNSTERMICSGDAMCRLCVVRPVIMATVTRDRDNPGNSLL